MTEKGLGLIRGGVRVMVGNRARLGVNAATGKGMTWSTTRNEMPSTAG